MPKQLHETESYYCDHCGDLLYENTDSKVNPRGYVQHKQWVPYTHVPWDVASANKGESACLCVECVRELDTF